MAKTTSTLGRCKGDIHRSRGDQLSHLLARRLDTRFQFRAEFVRAGGIAPFRRKVSAPLRDLRAHGISVYACFNLATPMAR